MEMSDTPAFIQAPALIVLKQATPLFNHAVIQAEALIRVSFSNLLTVT